MMPQASRHLHAGVRSVAGVLFIALSPFIVRTAVPAANWPTFDGNPARAAWLNSDTSLSPQNVTTLKRHWVTKLDNTADSTPIFVEQVQRRGRASGPMLFQTDGAGETYGIDAKTGNIVWRYKTSGPNITASTPVMDPAGADIYVPGVDGYVHKLNAATGAEVSAPGFPAQITLIPQSEKDASPLNLANGYLYAATSGYIGDAPYYDGHVVAVHLSDGKTRVFNSLCSNLHMLITGSQCTSVRSGIWARAGVVVDPDSSMSGRIYASTGNGPFASAHFDYGDSAIQLAADASSLVSSYTPNDFRKLSTQDIDLGSTAPAMLPKIPKSQTPLLAVQGGKDQMLHLLNRTNLGGVGAALQLVPLPGEVFTAPAVWQESSGKIWIFVGILPDSSDVLAFNVVTAHGVSRLKASWSSNVGGTSPVAINGLVFVATSGVLNALDARNGNVLWASTGSGVGGTIGSIHWESPIAVDGAVYISDQSGNLTAYSVNGS